LVTARVTCLQVGDPFNLQRFANAQARECSYPQVLRELGEGRKQGQWI
jgi:uncharacterized protein (DUF1810 family)